MSDAVATGPTAGSLLRQAREAAGLHVAALAVALKVPVRKLEALEDDRHDALPDMVFARALAASVCRTLKTDPQPILARLPLGNAPRLMRKQAIINTPFRGPGDSKGPGWSDQLTRPVFLVVFALLLGALVLIFMPTAAREELATKPTESPGVPMAPIVLAPGAEAPAAGAPAQSPAAVSAAPAPVGVPVTAVVAPSGEQPGAPVPTDPAALSATGVVVFKATGPSWVQVTDAKGTVTLRRLMGAGETAGAAGSPPLTVTVGSASATTVRVRGKPYDLANVTTKDNVARFEVK